MTHGAPEHQSVCDTPQLGDITSDTCWVQQSQRVTVSLNRRWTDPGHVTRGQTSTKLVPKPYNTEAGRSPPRESPHQLQSGGSFLQHWGLGEGRPGGVLWRGGRRETHTFHFGRIRLTVSASFKWF